MAEREGFEPSMRCRIHTFQACSFDRSDTSPGFARPLRVAAVRPSRIPAHALAATVAPFRAWRGLQPNVAGGPDRTAMDPVSAAERGPKPTLGPVPSLRCLAPRQSATSHSLAGKRSLAQARNNEHTVFGMRELRCCFFPYCFLKPQIFSGSRNPLRDAGAGTGCRRANPVRSSGSRNSLWDAGGWNSATPRRDERGDG